MVAFCDMLKLRAGIQRIEKEANRIMKSGWN